MTTALEYFHQPVRSEESGKIPRRPSPPTMTTSAGSSYNNNNNTNAPLSTLEDSGNINNRGLLQSSSNTTNNKFLRSNSNSSLNKPRSVSRGRSNDANGTFDKDNSNNIVIEEKRKRSNGDGYTIHKYTLGRMLGKGGFAKVYMCTAMDTGKNYAVKVVPKTNLVKARARQKLQAEIKIHRMLKHRYVCQYKHYFEDRENCYILLELCHNQSLNEMIKRRKRLTEPEAAYFMKQLLEATQYMHGQNVIHRDLKLGNLFLDKDMNIKVGDLGLATKVEDKDEKRKTICGTPNYIAPEIIQGDKAKRGHSFEVDVWSMGVILYTVLVGKPPYEAKDVKATYQRILNNEYSFPRHVEISSTAKSLIRSMLQSKPTDRPGLDEIECHPFLVDGRIPSFLPSTTLSLAPVWKLNEYGEMICTDKSSSFASKLGLPRSSSRQPFSSRDPNTAKTENNSGKIGRTKEARDVINMERVVNRAVEAMTGKPAAPPKNGFKIYDETETIQALLENKNAFERDESPGVEPTEAKSLFSGKIPSETLTEEALAKRTKALTIQNSAATKTGSAVASSVFTYTESVVTNSENDADILQQMADHLDTVINVTETRKGSYRAIPLHPMSPRHGPNKWVTRYVDYTSKYGLGFLLNDGSSGVYFNDSTKTALQSSGDTFQYIERKKIEDKGNPMRRGETTVEAYTLEKYPDALKKKVTLLKHFRNYLVQQQMNDGQDDFDSDTSCCATDLVYVKKWVRTKHAILFSLSNRTVQVIFYDQTEILLTPDIAFLTYVDKQRRRATYSFTDELVGSSPEIEKRLKYAKEIMLQLLSGR